LLNGRARQWAKVGQIREALLDAGYRTLDAQAEALGISRSTAWSILRSKHKSTGLSTAVILTMLSKSQLPPAVRDRLREYVEEKALGLYGDKPFRVRQFMRRLSVAEPQTLLPEYLTAIAESDIADDV
jgi:predicted DNA-binding transcriptional regulator AlpA